MQARVLVHSGVVLPVAVLQDKSRLWVRFRNSRPVNIDPGQAKDVSGFLKIIKKEMSPDTDLYSVSKLNLLKPDGEVALPSDDIESLLTVVSYDTPLILEDPRITIFIRNVDEELRPLDTFMEMIVESDADVQRIWEGKGSALIKLSEPVKLLTKFDQLENGGKYYVYSRYEQSMLDEVRWQQREDQAMEVEIFHAVKAFLLQELGARVEQLPTDLAIAGGIVSQEWEAIFKVQDTLYLCEAKHVMSIENL